MYIWKRCGECFVSWMKGKRVMEVKSNEVAISHLCSNYKRRKISTSRLSSLIFANYGEDHKVLPSNKWEAIYFCPFLLVKKVQKRCLINILGLLTKDFYSSEDSRWYETLFWIRVFRILHFESRFLSLISV